MFKDLDFTPGKIVFWGLDINLDMSIDNDNTFLDEDMLQVEYPNELLIDAGWYEGSKSFCIHIIKEHNWEKPLVKRSCKTLKQLKKTLNECIDKVRELIEKENSLKK